MIMLMQDHRDEHIDFLRAITIIAIIVVHTLQYNLASPLAYFIWNYLHFDVVAFVFCSGYVLTARYKNSFSGIQKTIGWIIKRIVRLAIPFYIYLFVHYALWFLFPNIFNGLGLQKSLNFFLLSVSFIGGIDINWLPLLFLQLALLFPLCIVILKNKILTFIYIAAATTITVYFTIVTFPYSYYRAVMWIPWSLILLFSILAYRYGTNKQYILSVITGALLFILISFIWGPSHPHLRLIDHKYPPDFYYLSYAISATSLLFLVSKWRVLYSGILNSFWTYISIYSYELFFIHYIVLDAFRATSKLSLIWSNQLIQCIVVISFSLIISYVLRMPKFIRTNK